MRRRALAVLLAVLAVLSVGSARAGTPYEYQPYVGPFVTVSVDASPRGNGRGMEPMAEDSSPTPPSRPAGHGPSHAYHSERGTASWGAFGGHVVTRLRRGTHIQVCGPRRCWVGYSWGYGPESRTGRLVDLDITVFKSICGDPSVGLCDVTLRY